MFTDKEMQEMYEQHKDKFFDFKEFEEAVIQILAEEAYELRKSRGNRYTFPGGS
jgi:hypothetical protein